MTTGTHKERCEFCRNQKVGQHNKGCPELIGTPEAKVEWNEGWAVGFADEHIEWWQEKFYSPTFILGYRVGGAEIDRLVEEAVHYNTWGPEY